MATVNLDIEGTRLRVAAPRTLVRSLRKIVNDYTVDDDSPLGFVVTRHRRRFVLLDRCGFRLGSASGPDAAIALLVQHLAAFRRPPDDTVQFRLRTLLNGDRAVLTLYPVLYIPPADEGSLAEAGYRLVHRLDTWIQGSPPRALIVRERAAFHYFRSRDPLPVTEEMSISALALPSGLGDSRAARSVALIRASVEGPRQKIFDVATHLATTVPVLPIDLGRPLGPQLFRD
jgi:hypothetical protein